MAVRTCPKGGGLGAAASRPATGKSEDAGRNAMTQASGATGVRRVRRSLALPLIAAMVLTLLMPYAAQAVHDTVFFPLDCDAHTSRNTAVTLAALDDCDK